MRPAYFTLACCPGQDFLGQGTKTIFAIARSQKLDLKPLLQNRFRRPDDLSIKEASALIDDMKAHHDNEE